MVPLTISVPDDYADFVVAAFREEYPSETAGLGDAAAASAAVKQLVKGAVRRYALRHADTQAVLDAQAAAAKAETAKVAVARSRKNAESAALDNVDIRFKEVT